MEKIKIIYLLNKIANGEEVPKKIKWEDKEWKYNPINDYEGIKYGGCLLNQVTLDRLNDEVEILEEPKGMPEKINNSYYHLEQGEQNQLFKNKINEIIDYLESKGE